VWSRGLERTLTLSPLFPVPRAGSTDPVMVAGITYTLPPCAEVTIQ